MKKELSPLERGYLNAVYYYHINNSSSSEDSRISKEVFALLRAGRIEQAAIKAGESPVTLQIWEMALESADNKKSEVNK